MSIEHKVGDIVMGVNADDDNILGVIKKKKISQNDLTYQVEWANDLHCDQWYKESNVNAFKMLFEAYMRRKKNKCMSIR